MSDNFQNKKLIIAIQDGDLDGVNAAIKEGADVNVIVYHPEDYDLCLSAQIGINIDDDQCWWPLNLAISISPDKDIVEALLNAGANINTPGCFSPTLLMDTVNLNRDLALIQLLIDRGADLNTVDEEDPPFDWCDDNDKARALIEEALLKRRIKQTTKPINDELTL